MKRSRRRGPKKPHKQIPRFDRNNYIKADEVRVVTDEGSLGVMPTRRALELARERDLDLVLINPKGNPPVARIVSWSKFKYDLSKKQKNSSSKTSELKEMRFKPFIDQGDMDHKIKKVRQFIEKGNKVKITILFKRGADRDKINEVMDQIVEQVQEFAGFEGDRKREGMNLSIFLTPKS